MYELFIIEWANKRTIESTNAYRWMPKRRQTGRQTNKKDFEFQNVFLMATGKELKLASKLGIETTNTT